MTDKLRLASEEDIDSVRDSSYFPYTPLTRVADTARIGLEAIALLRQTARMHYDCLCRDRRKAIDAFLARLDGAGAEEGK